MANRFWVGGGSSTAWSATANTNWATTSGGANNASVPGTGDLAIFDSNSGVGTSALTASITIQGLDCTGGTGNYAGTITHASSQTLTINTGAASSLRFSSGMTYTPAAASSVIAFTHTSGTANITSAGKSFGGITQSGAGGTIQLLDDLTLNQSTFANAILTHSGGTFDANGHNVTVNKFNGSNSNTRTLTLGSGTWTLGSNLTLNQTMWDLSTTTNLTFNKNTANIVIANNTNTSCIEKAFFPGALTYNGITINNSSVRTTIEFGAQAVTWASFTLGTGTNIGFGPGVVTTISTAPTFTGSISSPILLNAGTIGGTTATLTVPSGNVTLNFGGLQSIIANGGAVFTATNTFDFGNNTGWSIATPTDATLSAPTAAQVATAVWTDTTVGDFTVSASVGQSVMNGVALGTGLTVNDITTKTGYSLSGTQTFNNTGNITGNLSGSVGSVTGAVGSVTGSVGSVTGLTASNLDTTVSSRLASASYTAPDSAATIAAAVWAVTIETGYTALQLLRLYSSVLLSKISGGATTTNTFRDINDTKARVTATVDSSGNRTNITLDAS